MGPKKVVLILNREVVLLQRYPLVRNKKEKFGTGKNRSHWRGGLLIEVVFMGGSTVVLWGMERRKVALVEFTEKPTTRQIARHMVDIFSVLSVMATATVVC